MKYKKGQAVYHIENAECLCVTECCTEYSDVRDMRGNLFVANNNLLRSLHSTPGFYVPEVGDVRPEGYQVYGINGWTTRVSVGAKILEDDSNKTFRFPIPPESTESEKWAREHEKITKVKGLKTEDGKIVIIEDVSEEKECGEGIVMQQEPKESTLNRLNVKELEEQLKQLLVCTWDGNLISKHNRDKLVNGGYADRGYGWNWITRDGIKYLDMFDLLKDKHTVTSVSVGEGLTGEDVNELNDSMTKRSTWINWRPVTERPKVGEIILIYNINGVYAICWNDDISFGKNETGWEYQSEFNAPSFPDPLIDLARKLRTCTEAEAVAILKERGV